MDSIDSTKWLTKQIIDYVKDNTHKYAIAIEGEWGSGKTRYLETVVSSVLNQTDKRLVRVSLFGIKDANELYEKLVAALFRIGEDEKGKIKAFWRGAVTQIPSIASLLASIAGVTFNLNVNAKTVVDLLIKDRDVIAFDDTERRDKDSDDMSLFGAINDLVEGKNIKVILVSNAIDPEVRQGGFDKDIREKLVWRIFSYKPSPEDLVNEIFGSLELNTGIVDCVKCIQQAAIRVDCRNVRAMIRAESFIKKICSIPSLDNDLIAISSREHALTDAIQFALLKCKGENLNEMPKYEREVGITPEYLDYLAKKEMFEKYADFPCIDEYFDPRGNCKSVDIEAGFKEYVSIRYPNTSETVEFLRIKDDLANFHQMDDSEVALIIPRLVSVIRGAGYSPSLIRDAVSWNCQLSDIGFDGLLDSNELIEACKKTIDNSPSEAQDFFNHAAFLFSPATDEIENVLKSLREYTDTAYLNDIKNSNAKNVDFSNPNCGMMLAHSMNETWTKNSTHIIDYSPKIIVETFVSSNGLGQNEIRSVFIKMQSFSFSFMDDSDFAIWLRDIKQQLIDITECENMTKVRKEWFISNIDDLLSQHSSNAPLA